MNDSFLDELEIIHSEALPNLGRQAEQYITTRGSRSTGAPSNSNNLEDLKECQENIIVNTNSLDSKDVKKNEFIKDPKRQSTRQHEANKQTEQELKNKVTYAKQSSKEHNRRSGSSTPSGRTCDRTSKENNVLPDFPKDINLHSNAAHSRNSAASRKLEIKDPAALLNAIKELVSTYSKQETTKILRTMQELHINSQVNMIKHFLIQTEDLTNEIHPSKDTSRLRKLVEENERMREDIIILGLRNEELQRKVDESILIREENISLKLKLKELLKAGS